MKEVRIGIIGVGTVGMLHAENIYGGRVAGMRLCALCDEDEARAEFIHQKFPDVPVFRDYREMAVMGCCDAVIVSTPHYSHAIIATEALRAGLHVMVEKPIGVYAGQTDALVRAANESGKVFGIMFRQRTAPCYLEARRIIRDGEIGALRRLTWIITDIYRSQEYYDSAKWRATWRGEGGGVLINQAPHNLDIWQWLFGMPDRLRATCGVAKYHTIEVEDEAVIYAEYKSGATAIFQISTGERPGTDRLEIAGDLGKMVIEDGMLKLWRLRDQGGSHADGVIGASGDGSDFEYTELTFSNVRDSRCEMLENFADAVMNGAPLIAPGVEGVRELEISNAAYLSAWRDRWVDVPCSRKEFERELDAHRTAADRANGEKEKSFFARLGLKK